jgi:hypothetical protein
MGAVWPRAVAPMGSINSPQVRKLTMLLWSFIVAKAILRSTFLLATSTLRTIRSFLHARLAYHERGAIVKQERLRLSADVYLPVADSGSAITAVP